MGPARVNRSGTILTVRLEEEKTLCSSERSVVAVKQAAMC